MARYRLRLLLQEFDVPPGETVLGRSPECHITIDDPLVSREHAKVLHMGDRVILRDLGSRNGSKINGDPLHGEIELKDGDRIRIGNQEILFTRVVAPNRPGRPTGSLRHCSSCRAPYLAEAPSCPHCGFVPGAEDTLSGRKIALDRQSWSLQLQLELLEKALSVGRMQEADRALKSIDEQIEKRLDAKGEIDPQQLNAACAGAIKLSSTRGDGLWVAWIFGTLTHAIKLPLPTLVAMLAQLPPIILDDVGTQLDQYVGFLGTHAGTLGPHEAEVIRALTSLRDEVQARRARAPQGRG